MLPSNASQNVFLNNEFSFVDSAHHYFSFIHHRFNFAVDKGQLHAVSSVCPEPTWLDSTDEGGNTFESR